MDAMRSPSRPTTGYLPGFLLGESEPMGLIADNSRISTAGGTTSPKDVEMTFAGSISPQSASTPSRPSPNYGRNTKPTISRPPLLSLYDELDNSSTESKENQPSDRIETPQPTMGEGPGHWVLVFGFPPSASAHVLSLFNQIGTVVENSFPTSGNWMFVKYATRSDARKALSYDSRIINGNIMIAVREGKNVNQMRTAYPSSPTLHNSSMLNRTTGSPSAVLSPKIRPVGTFKRSLPVQPALDTSATSSSPGVVSKAIDFIFNGW